jgi:hypothetical protein
VTKLLNDAVDQTRRAEHQQLQAEGDDTLKHTRYLWLHGQLPEVTQAGFAELLEINLKTAGAPFAGAQVGATTHIKCCHPTRNFERPDSTGLEHPVWQRSPLATGPRH